MSFFLGRVLKRGIDFIAQGFGGGGGGAPVVVVVPVVSVCGETSIGLTSHGRTAIGRNPVGAALVGLDVTGSTRVAPITVGRSPVSNC